MIIRLRSILSYDAGESREREEERDSLSHRNGPLCPSTYEDQESWAMPAVVLAHSGAGSTNSASGSLRASEALTPSSEETPRRLSSSTES
mmetsp:Transcript_15135/g.21218  ORF Transcript_15135/g.21218 Transcript_15135/m.21218 type:complete len:90 (-) Transcript_15135:320-589(-)